MSNRMQGYYFSQAEVLQAILNQGNEAMQDFCQRHKAATRLCLVGSGSSFFCAQTASPFLKRQTGLEVLALLPGRAEEMLPLPGDLMLLITQEGKSVNVMRVAEHLKKLGKSFCTVTALPDSPTAQIAEECLSLGCGEEVSGPKTMGVTSTLLLLRRLALELGLARGALSQEAYQKKYGGTDGGDPISGSHASKQSGMDSAKRGVFYAGSLLRDHQRRAALLSGAGGRVKALGNPLPSHRQL